MVRAKFKVTSITSTIQSSGVKQEDGSTNYVDEELRTPKLHPVTSGSDENKQFFRWTPGGEISLGTVSKEAGEYFKIGKEYYVDFTEVE